MSSTETIKPIEGDITTTAQGATASAVVTVDTGTRDGANLPITTVTVGQSGNVIFSVVRSNMELLVDALLEHMAMLDGTLDPTLITTPPAADQARADRRAARIDQLGLVNPRTPVVVDPPLKVGKLAQ